MIAHQSSYILLNYAINGKNNFPLTYPCIPYFLFSQSQRTPAEETDKRVEPGNPAEFLYPGPSHLYSGPTPGGYSANSTPSGFTPGR